MTKQQESTTARAPFALQLEYMHQCIARLADQARAAESADPASVKGVVLQIGQTVAELEGLDREIQRRREELAAADTALEGERRRYKELFEFGPDGYLLTDLTGTVREGNRVAARLLHTSPSLLRGKHLISTSRKTADRLSRSRSPGSGSANRFWSGRPGFGCGLDRRASFRCRPQLSDPPMDG